MCAFTINPFLDKTITANSRYERLAKDSKFYCHGLSKSKLDEICHRCLSNLIYLFWIIW